MNITLRQLRVFLAVVRHRGFGRAGAEIGLTQSAVSRCLRELEAELAVRLVDRTTRDVETTPEGRVLAGELERLLGELDTLLLTARSRSAQRSGRVQVACAPTISASLMPTVIAESNRQYPQVRLVLHDLAQRQVLEAVRDGEVDFAVIVDPIRHDELELETVLTDPFCLICPSGHRLAGQHAVRWEALAGERLVLLDCHSGSRPLIDRVLAERKIVCEIAQEVGHATTVFRLVEAGIGISVMPALALPLPDNAGLLALPLLPQVTRQIMLARRHNRSLSLAAEVIWNLVRATARALPATNAGGRA
ncbi:LysR family transcriptional regulator [Microvirgula curvata]